MREVQNPLLRRVQKKARPFTLLIYGTELGKFSRLRQRDTDMQNDECYREGDVDNDYDVGSDFVGFWVFPADEEIVHALFVETHFGRITTCYLSQDVSSDHSIDTMHGIRRDYQNPQERGFAIFGTGDHWRYCAWPIIRRDEGTMEQNEFRYGMQIRTQKNIISDFFALNKL
jgi:hypothetical protein